MNKYLLSDEAMMDVIRKHHLLHSDAVVYITDDDRAVAKAAVKHCLEQLEKEGLLRHDAKIVAEQTGRGFVNLTICREDCRACAKLREVRA